MYTYISGTNSLKSPVNVKPSEFAFYCTRQNRISRPQKKNVTNEFFSFFRSVTESIVGSRTRRSAAASVNGGKGGGGGDGTRLTPQSRGLRPELDSGPHHVRGGGWCVAGQSAAQAQTPEHGRCGCAHPPTVPTPVPATSATIRTRLRGTPLARLVVTNAVHAHVAIRSGPVAESLRSGS